MTSLLPKDTRIGLLAPVSLPIPPIGYGPYETVLYNLARGLVQAGYTQVILYATKDTHIPGVKTHYLFDNPFSLSNQKGTHTLEMMHIVDSLKKAETEVDLIHNHLDAWPLILHEFSTKPIVTTLAGIGQEENLLTAYEKKRHLPFVSISDSERELMPELNYVATVYHGIDFNQFSFQAKPKDYLVCVGRMRQEKGIHNAIALAKKVKRPLYLAGIVQADCQNYFDQEIKPYIDNKTVFFLGNLSPQKVHQLVSHATAYIALIEWEEPFGLAIAEAMASGTPVIATPRGSQKELIIDGKNGIKVANVEAAALRFEEVIQINRELCRETAASIFDIPQMVSGYLDVYQKLLSSF